MLFCDTHVTNFLHCNSVGLVISADICVPFNNVIMKIDVRLGQVSSAMSLESQGEGGGSLMLQWDGGVIIQHIDGQFCSVRSDTCLAQGRRLLYGP